MTPSVTNPALIDLVALCLSELGPQRAAQVLARAGADASENSIGNAEELRVDADLERVGALQYWNHVWLELRASAPELFGYTSTSSIGAATSYALCEPHDLLTLELDALEADQLQAGRRALQHISQLLQIEPCLPYLVSPDCLALRHYLSLALPERTALSLGHEQELRRHVLFSESGVAQLRRSSSDVSELVLTLLHEELHVALACSSRSLAQTRQQPLALATEEAVVSALDLVAGHVLRCAVVPTRQELLTLAPSGCYPQLVASLLAQMDDEQLLANLVELGLVATEGDDDVVAPALNKANGQQQSREWWQDLLRI